MLKWSGEREVGSMKAHTQRNMGLITAGVLFVVGTYMLVLWHNVPLFTFFGYPLTMFCLIYTFVLYIEKLRIARVVYQLLRYGGLVMLTVITMVSIVTYPKWFDGVRSAVEVGILLSVWLLYGCVVLLLRNGLKGLEQVKGSGTNRKTRKENG